MKKKYSKSLKFLVPSFLMLGSSAILSSTVLSSCVNNNKTNITINSQTGVNQELDTNDENGLTLSVEAVSTQGNNLTYQWFVNKNANNWEAIEGATYPTYNVSQDDIKGVDSATAWKYKAEIYQDDDKTIKTETKVITVNIKPTENSSTEEEDTSTPNQPEETPPTTPDGDTSNPDTDTNPPVTNPENPTPNEPSKPEEPAPTPPEQNKPTTPEESIPPSQETPNKPSAPSDSTITENSVQLKNSKTTLPSQYLTSLNEAEINKDLLITNFDASKITNVSYKVDAFNDKDGTLSLTMTYTSNARSSEHKFSFNNLLKLDEKANYQLSFIGARESKLISAQDFVNKSSNEKDFKELLTEWDKLGVKSKIKFGNVNLPIDYLTFSSSPIVTGFNHNWFIKNKPVDVGLTFKDAKIKYFYKENSSSSISSNTFSSNVLNRKVSIKFASAVDFLQHKITSNESYQESDKTAEQYYKEINEQGTKIIESKLVNGQWLSNVTDSLTYNNQTYKYKIEVGHKNGIFLNKDKKLFIPINVKYVGNSSSTPTSSTRFRNIEIKSLK